VDRQEQLAGVTAGDILAGKYRVDRVLGVGGMGVVVAAHHLHLDERVAIKFLLPETLTNADAVMRFAREARAAVKIKSEHVARVTDVGTLETGAPYMVMEYLEGEDLGNWLLSKGSLSLEQAVDFLLQACEAIAEAHSIGIIHRDLKPANLFVARLPGGVQSVKVLDFGISKLTGMSASGAQGTDTKTSIMMGSPLYMSPEQMQSSKDVDTRADLWALGVILYELLTGVSPYVADSMPELILKIVSKPPDPLRIRRPDVPEALEAVLLRCLERDRNRRYQTVGELAFALAPFGTRKARHSVERITQVMTAAGMSTSAPELPAVSMVPPSAVGAATSGAFGGSVPGPKRTSATVMIGAVAVGVAALGVGAMVAMRVLGGPAPESIASAEVTADPKGPVESAKAGAAPVAPAVVTATVPTANTAAVMEPAGSPSASPSPVASSTAAPPVAARPPAARPTRRVTTTKAPAAPAQPDSPKKKPASLIDDRF
jgi:tRNA A-37 threonylcarbamoyl transferase component Bud32